MRNGRKSATVKTKETKDKGRNGATKKGRLQDKGTKRIGGETERERDRQREMIHYLCRLQQENLSGLPSPSRARWAITVMSATARVTSCIYSITACTDV